MKLINLIKGINLVELGMSFLVLIVIAGIGYGIAMVIMGSYHSAAAFQ